MKTLYWTYGSIVASFVLLLGIWGIVDESRWTEAFTPDPPKVASQENITAPDELVGPDALYAAVAERRDIARYRAIASLTREKKWKEADAIIARLDNPALVGHFLAIRYTDKEYTPTSMQLMLWLANNNYLPQADAVLLRLKKLYPQEMKEAIRPAGYKALKGYSDSGRARLSLRAEDNEQWKSGFGSLGSGHFQEAYKAGIAIVRNSAGESQHGNWLAGLAAWRLNDIPTAARHFTAMALSDQVAPSYKAGAAFWAYRSYKALGNREKAQQYLEMAASAPQSFYGIVAAAELGQPTLRPQMSAISSSKQWKQFLNGNPVAQIVLLDAIGETAAAERLMRRSYYNFSLPERRKLMTLANELGMASVVLPMARYSGAAEAEVLAAHYPIPVWRGKLSTASDHALVLAIVKQESGFNPSVSSPQGARGLMQILPSTAEYMRKQKGALSVETAALDGSGIEVLPKTWNLLDPEYNLAIGQAYLRYLLDKPYIHGNLVYMLVGYNAGAGPLLRWKETLGEDDPLLFIESIPYAETRHYVKNVMRNYWVYRSILHQDDVTPSLAHIVGGQWPRIS